MNITINKDTPIEQLIEYLKVNRHNLNDVIANSLRSNFKTIGDIYNVSYQELSTLPEISKIYSARLAMIFIINDYLVSRNSNLVNSLLKNHKNLPARVDILKKSGHFERFKNWTIKHDSIYSFLSFVKYLDELNQQSIQETNVTKQPQQTDDKSFRLIQKLLEIWNDDVEQQVEDIINQSR